MPCHAMLCHAMLCYATPAGHARRPAPATACSPQPTIRYTHSPASPEAEALLDDATKVLPTVLTRIIMSHHHLRLTDFVQQHPHFRWRQQDNTVTHLSLHTANSYRHLQLHPYHHRALPSRPPPLPLPFPLCPLTGVVILSCLWALRLVT
ncbi:hypothetical protein GGR56DRAFT_428166 [Xylariaceae sp. FL0804]|nr:hypothetical protein GGR56DRAFT_428166 [Xylariaceae sp. FL0804]